MFHLTKTNLFIWQKKCLEAWFNNNLRGIVNVVTGAGKTILALGAIASLERMEHICDKGKLKIKIVVPKVFLANQWVNSIKDELLVSHEQIGIYNGSFKVCTSKKFMIYVINSARYTLSKHILSDLKKGYSVFLICDECHHCTSTENSKIFDFLPFLSDYPSKFFSLGLSATPETQNYHNVLVPELGEEIFKYDFKTAVNAKIISNYTIFNVNLNFMPEESLQYEDLSRRLRLNLIKIKQLLPSLRRLEGSMFYLKLQGLCAISSKPEIASLAQAILSVTYKRKEIVHCAKSRINCACELIQRLFDDSKIIIFGERIEMTDVLYKRLTEKYPAQVVKYHSEMSNIAKKTALYRYRNAEARILVCCKALDEGLNVPETDVGIILSSTGSIRQRIQRIGRILRQSKNETLKKIYYLHISDSSEESELIPSDIRGNTKIINLTYDYKSNSISQQIYDELALKTLSNVEQKNIHPVITAELAENLRLGAASCDWQISEEECLQNVNEATTTKKRNYWIAMLQMLRNK